MRSAVGWLTVLGSVAPGPPPFHTLHRVGPQGRPRRLLSQNNYLEITSRYSPGSATATTTSWRVRRGPTPASSSPLASSPSAATRATPGQRAGRSTLR